MAVHGLMNASCKIVVSDLPPPVVRLPIINNPTLWLPERNLLAAIPYSGTGADGMLILVDVEAMKDRKYALPPGEKGAYGFAKGIDGRLYLGTFSGRMFAFNIDRELFSELAQPFQNGQMIWGGAASSSGKVYMGAVPTGEFCEYDVSSGAWRVFNPAPERNGSLYAKQFIELPDGRMLIGIWGAEDFTLMYDPATRTWERFLSEFIKFQCFYDDTRMITSNFRLFNWRTREYEGPFIDPLPGKDEICAGVKVGDRFYVVGSPSESVYEVSGRRLRVVKEAAPEGNSAKSIHYHERADELLLMGENGLFMRFHPTRRATRSFHVRNESTQGMNILGLLALPEQNLVVGSFFICMQIFKIDLKKNQADASLHKIAPYRGQVCNMTCLNGKVYMASYGHAVLYVWDPALPYVYGRNPRIIAEIGDEQNRPCGMANDGKRIYIATKAAYQKLGGAITVLDPQTEKWDVYRNFVPEQNPNSLFYHAPTGCLAGTTEIFGEQKTHAPTAQQAYVFLWDTAQRKTVYTGFPWQHESLSAYALSPGGKLIGSREGEYYLFDVNKQTFEIQPLPPAEGENLLRGGVFMGRRYFYGADKTHLIRLDIEHHELDYVREIKFAYNYAFTKLSENEFLYAEPPAQIRRIVLS